jgi:hypothetical protein
MATKQLLHYSYKYNQFFKTLIIMNKICSQCGLNKPINEFSINRQAKSGIRSYCKECNRNYDLRRRYNVNIQLVDNMLKEQNGMFAICKKKFENRKETHLDHNHDTGKTRQLLCRNCNHLIGNCDENITTLISSIEYLKKWS